LKIKRLDHHGIVAGIIDDLGIVALIDNSIKQDEQQEITTGEAVKGMIMNGLGFSNRPLSLSPQFFTNLPMEHLFRPGVEANHFNRHKLGRTLDQCYDYGSSELFSQIAEKACREESVDTSCQSLDTTSYSLSGDYESTLEQEDSAAITITHGYSKDKRADLKQVVQEIIVSQDGGIPLACKAWDGNTSDNKIFKERTRNLIQSFKSSDMPQYLIADSKLYHQENSPFLSQINFITLVPSTNKQERLQISLAIEEDNWVKIDDNYRYHAYQLKHMDISQRWIVVYSNAARDRAENTINKQVNRAKDKLEKDLFHLQAQRFACETDANKALDKLIKKLKYHKIVDRQCIAHQKYKGKGRPTTNTPTETTWQITATFNEQQAAIDKAIEQKSCFVLATNVDEKEMDNETILQRYKSQSTVERGFRFLKDPLFFVSSLFLKKPSRIDALLMIMLLSLLVYSIAQRRMRATMKSQKATVPSQINQPNPSPTLRWMFQCFEGINLVQPSEKYDYSTIILDGMDELRLRVTTYLGERVAWLYKNKNFQMVG